MLPITMKLLPGPRLTCVPDIVSPGPPGVSVSLSTTIGEFCATVIGFEIGLEMVVIGIAPLEDVVEVGRGITEIPDGLLIVRLG